MRKRRELEQFVQEAEADENLRTALRALSGVEMYEFGSTLERDGLGAVRMLVRDRMSKASGEVLEAYQILIPYLEKADALPFRSAIRGFAIKKLTSIVQYPERQEGSVIDNERMDSHQD